MVSNQQTPRDNRMCPETAPNRPLSGEKIVPHWGPLAASVWSENNWWSVIGEMQIRTELSTIPSLCSQKHKAGPCWMLVPLPCRVMACSSRWGALRRRALGERLARSIQSYNAHICWVGALLRISSKGGNAWLWVAAFEWRALCKMTGSDGTRHSPSCKTAATKRMHVYVPVDMKWHK